MLAQYQAAQERHSIQGPLLPRQTITQSEKSLVDIVVVIFIFIRNKSMNEESSRWPASRRWPDLSLCHTNPRPRHPRPAVGIRELQGSRCRCLCGRSADRYSTRVGHAAYRWRFFTPCQLDAQCDIMSVSASPRGSRRFLRLKIAGWRKEVMDEGLLHSPTRPWWSWNFSLRA